MGANPTFKDRVRYTLFNPQMGSTTIIEPQGWDDDNKEIARHEEYHGIFAKFSSGLKFLGNGADYIKTVYDLYGVEALIRLTRDVANPQTDLWERDYEGDLDLSTYEIEKGIITVKFNNAGFEPILKSRENENVEIERITTMDGGAMDPLRVDTVALTGRRILLRSLFDIQETDNTASMYMSAGSNSGGTDRAVSVGVPLNLYSQSHENAHSVIPETTGGESQGTTGIMFFAVTEVPRTLHIKVSLTFTTSLTHKDNVNHAFYGLFISKYSGGTDYNIVNRDVELFNTDGVGGIDALGGVYFANVSTGQNDNPAHTWSVEWEGDIFLNTGESASLEFYGKSNLGGTFNDGAFGVVAFNIDGNLDIIEDSFYEATQSKCVLSFEMASRLIEIMTGNKTALKSTIFGRRDLGYENDGAASLVGYTHGFWVRGFDALPLSTEEEINSFKPLTTSFKNFIQANRAAWNIGLGIERTGYRENIVIEELSYFYQRKITVRLPNPIKNAKRAAAANYYYSGIELGYAKGGDYQEAMGLDEYNAKSTFTTIIKRIKNVYTMLSEYRADSYGKEFARRKQQAQYPTEDTTYDNDVFMMDLKRDPLDPATPASQSQFIFLERKWQDDFAQAPTGTYSPETATNLRLSPFNILLRHGWVIASGLVKYAADYVRYGSSTANSGLTTKLIGGNEYAENGNILNGELNRARYVPETIEFEHEAGTSIMQQVSGYTNISGRRVPNVYGLFEFTNENGEIERGYLINLKPNDKKFKLLIANR